MQEFRIESVLGQGGFGVSYLAYDEYLHLNVVLKEYLPAAVAKRSSGSTVVPVTDKSKEDYVWGLTRFQEEAQTLARLNHKNIVTVKRVFPANGTAYMVMEYLSGGSMEDRLNQGQISPQDYMAVLDDIIDGLDYVHGQSFLHRDIAPDNIMFTDHGDPVLIDFGAARQQVEGKSKPISAIVKEGYAPLEQYNEHSPQGAYTDIYALSALCFEVITGKRPAASTVRVDADYDPVEKLAASANSVYSAWPEAFLSAVDKGLEIRRQDRPQSLKIWRKLFTEDPKSDTEKRLIQMVKNAWADGVITPEERQTLYLASEAFGFDQAFADAAINHYAPSSPPAANVSPPSSPAGSPPPPAGAIPPRQSNAVKYIIIAIILLAIGVVGYTQYQIMEEAGRRENAAYNTAVSKNSETAFKRFMDAYPDSQKYSAAKRRYENLRKARLAREADDAAYKAAKQKGTIKALQAYLYNSKYRRHRTAAAKDIQRIRDRAKHYNDANMIKQARAKKTFAAYQAYVSRHPNGRHKSEAYSMMGRYKRDGGGGVAKNNADARRYFIVAADRGWSYAAARLAFMYQRGLGGSRNYYTSKRYYKICADKKNANCAYQLGYMAEKGWGGRSDLEAARWYIKAKKYGSNISQTKIDTLKTKLKDQYNTLGGNYFYGRNGVTKSMTNARKNYAIGAEFGHPYSMLQLGYMLHNGLGGSSNKSQAFAWFVKAKNLGNRAATFNVGIYYYDGVGGVTRNYDTARSYFYQSAQKGFPRAMHYMGLVYERGLGSISRNYKTSASWYLKAARAGHKPAMVKMSEFYRKGLGVSRSTSSATYWAKKAK